jgi:thiaminase (transcriptional activator TenA)
MLLSEELWQANRDIVHSCCSSPLIQGLNHGTLPQEHLIHYLAQDVFLLEVFARAYSVAAAKAPDWQGFSRLQLLIGTVMDSIGLRHQMLHRWEIQGEVEARSTVPQSETQRYTDFLISTAWNEDIGLILIAIVPYLKLHLELGQQLALTKSPVTHRDWSEAYRSPAFQDSVSTLEDLVDRYALNSETRYSVYRHSFLCLRNFLGAMAPIAPSNRALEGWKLIIDAPV